MNRFMNSENTNRRRLQAEGWKLRVTSQAHGVIGRAFDPSDGSDYSGNASCHWSSCGQLAEAHVPKPRFGVVIREQQMAFDPVAEARRVLEFALGQCHLQFLAAD